MVEENRAKRLTFEDAAFTFLAFLLVAQMFQRLPILLEEHLGITIGDGSNSSLLVAGAALSLDTPIGTRVNAPGGSGFFTEPGGEGEPAGTFEPGASLIIRDGPKEDARGERWWYVEDPVTGKKGWVPESALVREGVGGIGPLTELGTRARALVDADVWDKPC
jgi:hypothetical protein